MEGKRLGIKLGDDRLKECSAAVAQESERKETASSRASTINVLKGEKI